MKDSMFKEGLHNKGVSAAVAALKEEVAETADNTYPERAADNEKDCSFASIDQRSAT